VVDYRNLEIMARTGKPVNGGANPLTAVGIVYHKTSFASSFQMPESFLLNI